MKLVKFSVTNFRSILKAQDIRISDKTVLVGKNNEGKSNLLKALSVAMEIIKYHARYNGGQYARQSFIKRARTSTNPLKNARQTPPEYSFRFGANNLYKWERDFPISKISGKVRKETVFKLEFHLNEQEIEEFKQEFRSKLNGILSLEITINIYGRYSIEVIKKGKGSKTLNLKANKITRYIARRISFNYIPSVRTHTEITTAIGTLLHNELSLLEDNLDYKKALEIINKGEKHILNNLSKKIKQPLSEFLPNLKKIKISLPEHSGRIRDTTDFNVEIDDGTLTSIEQKGDGVQSLIALGLLKNNARKTGASIIAIDEPESHLHPGAIHRLQKDIESLAKDNQVVIATHNPLFVNRKSIKSNIIINGGKADPAKDIMAIRDILGVQVSDNLTNARYALVVEGSEDKRSLEVILPTLSPKIKTALNNNELAIYPIGGAGNLSYYLSILKSQMCLYHVLLDYDDSANRHREIAIKEGLLESKNLTQTICEGISGSEFEFEDCIDPNIYKEIILNEHEVDLGIKIPNTVKKKWTHRVRACFKKHGKDFEDREKKKVKDTVVSCIKEDPSKALCKHKGNSIKALAKSLERLLDTE